MSRSIKLNWSLRSLLVLSLLVLVLSISGCLEANVDAGPNPSRVQVQVKAVVTDAEINEALHKHGEFGMPLVAGQFRTISGPYWTWKLLYVVDESNLRNLRSVSQTRRRDVKGHNLSGRDEFLVPPGKRRVRLLTQVFMEITFREGFGDEAREPVEVASYIEDFNLDLKPGESFNIQRSYAPPNYSQSQ